MTDDLVLPVPPVLPALYLVAASLPETDARRITTAAIARHVAEPVRRLARRLIGTPALVVGSREIEHTEYIAFAALTPPLPGPVHEWLTRAAAAAFATELGLPVMDPFAERLISAPDALGTLPGAPRLKDAEGGFRLADWVFVQHAGRCLTTTGLRRFGLPELKLDDVPVELHPSWTVALTGLGYRILESQRRALRRSVAGGGGETPFVEVPAQIEIGRADVAAAYGLRLRPRGGSTPVRLTFDPATDDAQDSYLAVGAPDGQPVAEHRLAVQATLLGPQQPAAGARR
jgi:hypothetical protein